MNINRVVATGYVEGPRFGSNLLDTINHVALGEGIVLIGERTTRWLTQRVDFTLTGNHRDVDIFIRALGRTCARSTGYTMGLDSCMPILRDGV